MRADEPGATRTQVVGQIEEQCVDGDVAKITDMTPERFLDVMDANVTQSWLMARAATKQMLAQGPSTSGNAGKIVLITSPAPAKDDDTGAPFKRFTRDELMKMNEVEQADHDFMKLHFKQIGRAHV